MAKSYNVSDGKMLLTLHPAEEGGYLVTSPLDPELVTQADSIEEAFVMARDLAKLLKKVRADWAGDLAKLRKDAAKRKRTA